MSTLRLPSLKAGACSELTLSGAFFPVLKGGLGAAEWVKKRPPEMWECFKKRDRILGSIIRKPRRGILVSRDIKESYARARRAKWTRVAGLEDSPNPHPVLKVSCSLSLSDDIVVVSVDAA